MITEIKLKHFRSYKNRTFKFSPGVNIIVGPNASGKTNLLEAILVACEGKSYRAGDIELIAFKQEIARIELLTDSKDTRVVYLESSPNNKKKSYKINNELFTRLSLQKRLPTVLFEPNNLSMLSGPADLRRQFLDDLLEKTKSGYGSLRRSYRRTLAQRNHLLKRENLTKDQLFAWDIRLCDLGGQIAKYRNNLAHDINELIGNVYESLSGAKAKIEFSYIATVPIEGYGTALLHKLEERVKEDRERGFTAYGPHREDIAISINGHPLQTSASRGEVRSMVLACKIIEAILIENEHNIKPILLFDDVFSELDSFRREQLTNFLHPYQSIITTTDADALQQHLTKKNKQIILIDTK